METLGFFQYDSIKTIAKSDYWDSVSLLDAYTNFSPPLYCSMTDSVYCYGVDGSKRRLDSSGNKVWNKNVVFSSPSLCSDGIRSSFVVKAHDVG